MIPLQLHLLLLVINYECQKVNDTALVLDKVSSFCYGPHRNDYCYQTGINGSYLIIQCKELEYSNDL